MNNKISKSQQERRQEEWLEYAKELIGKNFHKWTVIDNESQIYRMPKGNTVRKVHCRCECGFETFVILNLLRQGKSKGCINCGKKDKAEKYEHVPRAYFNVFKNAAIKERKRQFLLTFEQVEKLFIDQNSKCALSGVSIVFYKGSRYNKVVRADQNQTASLDRIDSSKDYIEGNIQWVHKDVNKMKTNMSDEQLIEWCFKILKNKKIV